MWWDAATRELGQELQAAHLASSHRSHASACTHLEAAHKLLLQDPQPAVREVDVLLALARSRFHAGYIAAAWEACSAVADLARETGDGAAMADAAVVLHGVTLSTVQPQIHALCIEALALLGDSDPVRRVRLRAQFAATGSIWVDEPYFDLEDIATSLLEAGSDPEACFITLEAAHAQFLAVEHVDERLKFATMAMSLGRGSGHDEYYAWGLLWRLEALYQLARLVEVYAEFSVLTSVVERLREPLWTCRIKMLHGTLCHLEGRYDEALEHTGAAAEISSKLGDETIGYIDLIMRSDVAMKTGHGLDEVETTVRRTLDGMPFEAKGWLVAVLVAAGKLEEARTLWKAVAPHVRSFPRRAPEWIVNHVTNAAICARLGDRATADYLYNELTPFAGQLATGTVQTPCAGPVDTALGMLARLLGNTEAAQRHLRNALHLAEAINAVPYAEQARRELASRAGGVETLTRREAEIAALVATGRSNLSIAEELSLSQRTVESHVSSTMRKLALPSRAAIAAWHSAQQR